MDKLKNYMMQFNDPKHTQVSEDEKYLVGTVILDYLAPLLDDPYIFETQLYSLLHDLAIIKKDQIAQCLFQAIDLSFLDQT